MSQFVHVQPGKPYPLGAVCDGDGANFAVFAANADKVELCFFDDPSDCIESRRVELTERTNHVWHVYAPGVRPGQLYGYRVTGPFDPAQGLRFNPDKLLFDPYAKAVGRPLQWGDELFGYPAAEGAPPAPRFTSIRCERDSACSAPLGAVIEGRFDWEDDQPPNIPIADSIIYELHVKGFTKQLPDVPPELRGTYAGLASEPALTHLQDLGITAVELLPVQSHVHERRLERLGLRNYWGYNTLAFFAPNPEYAADPTPEGAVREFKNMVRSLHRAGIEVLLDVVYNHTCEGNERGPTLSWRGFGNESYYRLDPLDSGRHVNYSGTGNTVDLRHPRALQMVLDSLRYWVEQMHVDGFRFDLASILGRESDHFDPGSGFFDAVAQDPTLSRAKLIAEPWDIGPGGYQVGGYPIGWSEWNGRYRDDIRKFWRGDSGMIGGFATRLSGSADMYDHRGREPSASINFVTAHDGFTLRDLVSYERKHNLANGEHNRDGESHNNSRNYGTEGLTENPEILAVRARQVRNFVATMLLSRGAPMLTAGDEFGRTQRGNNNAYCQDNEISWLSWDWTEEQRSLLDFVRRLIRLRRETRQFRRRGFYKGEPHPGSSFPDIAWYTPEGGRMAGPDWGDLERRVLGALVGDDGESEPLYLMVNASQRSIAFQLPPVLVGYHWELVFDTNRTETTSDSLLRVPRYETEARSFVCLRMHEQSEEPAS